MHDDRKQRLLGAVVEHFIKTAQPVGSKTVILTYDFKVSPATIRNDMAALEKEGLIMQPHTSAGRVPTDTGYRLYVDQLADYEAAQTMARQTIAQIRKQEDLAQAKQKVYEAVHLLSRACPNMAFATIPENNRTFFMGFSKILRQPEFMEAPMQASQVMEVIEDRQNFLGALGQMDIAEEAKIFIGQENIIHGIDSCSLIVSRYNYEGYEGYMGILGPKRMPYAYNASLLKEVITLLESREL